MLTVESTGMGKLNLRIERLRQELRQYTQGYLATVVDIQAAIDSVASLVLQSLFDANHPLHEQLVALEARIEAEKVGTLYRPVPIGDQKRERKPKYLRLERHFFMPHPGSSDPEGRMYWKLQLLLHTASRSSRYRAILADRLVISQRILREAADEAAAASINLWSESQFVAHLLDALEVLEFSDRDLPFVLDGRVAKLPIGSIRLSPQQAKLLLMLVQRLGQRVMFTQFNAAGINYPTDRKEELVARFKEVNIDLSIESRSQSYVLYPTSA